MSRGRVLLLEDDSALRSLLQEALSTEDFEVIVCDSYAEIRATAARASGHVIVADFWGGGQRHLSAVDRDEIHELGLLLPVILLTGRTWAAEATAAELGARALIRKPFDLDVLMGAIESALQRQAP
jgi:two-component system nitrogen regulation response regulator GlnG